MARLCWVVSAAIAVGLLPLDADAQSKGKHKLCAEFVKNSNAYTECMDRNRAAKTSQGTGFLLSQGPQSIRTQSMQGSSSQNPEANSIGSTGDPRLSIGGSQPTNIQSRGAASPQAAPRQIPLPHKGLTAPSALSQPGLLGGSSTGSGGTTGGTFKRPTTTTAR